MAGITLSSLSGGSVPNWQLVSSNSSLSGISTVTFSGLSIYAKYRLMAVNLVAVSGTSQVRINADSAANYAQAMLKDYTGGTPPNPAQADYYVNQTSILFSNNPGITPNYDIEIDNALGLFPKSIKGWAGEAAGATGYSGNLGLVTGVYSTSSVITSISIVRGANFTSGTIYLLGAN